LIDADEFLPVANAVVKFVGPEYAQIVTNDGQYETTLTPGIYTAYAYHYVNGTLQSYAKESIIVSGESTTFDFVLFSAAFGDVAEDPVVEQPEPVSTDLVIFALLGVAAAVLLFLLSRKKTTAIVGKNRDLDEDAHTVLEMIRRNEGRMVQKEIREILKWSETKMSLVVAELEASGHIKRIKKGRENILKIISK
jgi:uncharacterized membrane protein